jgi:hypothetical protein
MSIPGAGNPLLLGGAAGAAYKIERSLRFNSADSASLTKTFASAGNKKKWTLSFWVKRTAVDTNFYTILESSPSTNKTRIGFYINNLYIDNTWVTSFTWQSIAVFRDASAWCHITVALDTAQATASDRLKVYFNGVALSPTGGSSYPAQNQEPLINDIYGHAIGGISGTYASLYLADIHFIDGQALTPSSFGETDINGVWQPKAYSGTYGTNGFQLKFADNSAATATTLGKDTSGNGNNWTPNNLSVTAGAGNDSLTDSPTNYGTDTGAGGEVRGNYCTWNPLDKYTDVALANGNLDFSQSNAGFAKGTIGVSSGKWYWEVTKTDTANQCTGLCLPSITPTATFTGGTGTGSCGINQVSGTVFALAPFSTANGTTQIGAISNGSVIGCALDADNGTFKIYVDGVLRTANHVVFTPGITVMPSMGTNVLAGVYPTNFGQRPWAFTPPAGFKALCTQNLPAPTITKPSSVMDVALWTGNGSARSITGLGFNPDLVWIKGRSGATDHALYDSVRGATLDLVSNSTAAETTQTQGLTAFNSDGFSLGTLAKVNTNAATYAGWVFDAGSTTVTNTSGTISSQVRANASAGFSIVTYTGTGVTGTVGHGLVKPSLIIIKNRDSVLNWIVYHASRGATEYAWFNTTGAFAVASGPWNDTEPTSSVFTIGGANTNNNESTKKIVAYCFAPVAGYSAFGSYTGNGSADGPFVYTGFRPRWVMIKRTDTTGSWLMLDAARDSTNVVSPYLLAESAGAEDSAGAFDWLDFTSNGFKHRNTGAWHNASGGTYVYACFAEAPFALARAR